MKLQLIVTIFFAIVAAGEGAPKVAPKKGKLRKQKMEALFYEKDYTKKYLINIFPPFQLLEITKYNKRIIMLQEPSGQ